MIEHFILYTFIAILVSVVVFLLNRAARSEIKAGNDGITTLTMNKLYAVIAVIGLLLGLFIVLLPSFTTGLITDELVLVIGIMAFISWGTGVWCLLLFRNHRLVFDEKSITVTNELGAAKTMMWSDMQSIESSMLMGSLKIYSKKSKLTLHVHLVGLSTFKSKLESKTNLNAPR